MGKEIERKFLVVDPERVKAVAKRAVRIRQGYLSVEPQRIVRVRMRDERGFLTVKGLTQGMERSEWEYEIPGKDALEMLGICTGKIIDKTRYLVDFAGHTWEVDEFHCPVSIWLAEVELKSVDELIEFPQWIGREVTGNPDYYNSNLVK